MKYKKELKNLVTICKYKYSSCNGQEELELEVNNIIIEISIEFDKINLVINIDGNRFNYLKTDFFDSSTKNHLHSIINTCFDKKTKLSQIDIILYKFIKETYIDNVKWFNEVVNKYFNFTVLLKKWLISILKFVFSE